MDIADLRSRVTAELPRIRQDLEDLVRIESVSADPARAAEVQRSAEAVANLFEADGFEDPRIVSAREDGGAPALLAR
jgi:acetylornithine deacetylase/succinyl-diaminopimelate desuccinylase-like protein